MRPDFGVDLGEVGHHPALDAMVDVITTKTQVLDRTFFNVLAAHHLTKVAATMRTMVLTIAPKGEIPVNCYAIALGESGHGKGYSVTIAEQEFLKDFNETFRKNVWPEQVRARLYELAAQRAMNASTSVEDELSRIEAEFRKLGGYMSAYSSGTPEGIMSARQMQLMASAGALNYQVDEIGMNLSDARNLLALYLELYDQGLVKGKIIKGGKDNERLEELSGKSPANFFGFGSPTMIFDGDKVEAEFYALLRTGYARRCLFALAIPGSNTDDLTPEQIFDRLSEVRHEDTVNEWARYLGSLANPDLLGFTATLGREESILLLTYKKACETLSRSLASSAHIERAELSHRHSKAIKLAGAFSFLDQEPDISRTNLLRAIKIVEESGDAFERIMDRPRNYELLASHILEAGKELSQPDLMEALPFYNKGRGQRDEMMSLAMVTAYRRGGVIKKVFEGGMEFFSGESLEPVDLERVTLAYSNDWAHRYENMRVPFHQLPMLTQAEGLHWVNHHCAGGDRPEGAGDDWIPQGHRLTEKIVPGFDMVVLDVDGDFPLELARAVMKEFVHLVYTTKSHGLPGKGDRYRIVLPMNYRLRLGEAEFRQFMDNLHQAMPFRLSDDSSNQIAKKWETFPGEHWINLEGRPIDVLPFIPRTQRNEEWRGESRKLASLDNLERYFAMRMEEGAGHNNQFIRFGLALLDGGFDLETAKNMVRAFTKKVLSHVDEGELKRSVWVTMRKHSEEMGG